MIHTKAPDTTTYVLMRAEIFDGYVDVCPPGELDFTSPQEIFDFVLRDMKPFMEEALLGDEIAGIPPCGTVATSGCGIAVRDNLDHALIWFRKPENLLSFHEHTGMLFSINKKKYETAIHLWPSLLTRQGSGIHCVSDQTINLLTGSADPIGTHPTYGEAILATQSDINFLYGPVVRRS